MTKKVIYSSKFREFSVNACKYRKYGLYVDILNPAIDQLQILLERHSRIMVLRFDCRFPPSWNINRKLENDLASALSESIKDKLGSKRWGSLKDFAYGWVYEVGKTCGRPHYHFYIAFKALIRTPGAVTCDGNTGLLGVVQDCWNRLSDGSVYFAGTHIVNRGNQKELNNCIHHISYMAKVETKVIGQGNTAKNFSFSRLRSRCSGLP